MGCSGDGVLHEIINALVRRPDWDTFKETIVLSMIPGGTSNGYCTSVLRSIGENYGVLEGCYRLLAGKRSYMDLVELNGEYESKKIYMFLMFSWGLIADIAQNSENMRCLGTGRYTMRALYRICWMP
jgi:sphingosine kinase